MNRKKIQQIFNLKNFIYLVLVVAILFLLFHRPAPTINKVVVRDTVWHETTKTIIKQMEEVGGDEGYIPPGEDMYIAVDSYDSLLTKFNTLVKEMTARKFYKDSLQLDSVGYIVVKDTVQFNKLQKRSYTYLYKIPTITERITITKETKPTNQLYVGLGVSNNSSLQAGILFKTKSDKIFGAYVSPDLRSNNIYYGFQTHWKIKLKK